MIISLLIATAFTFKSYQCDTTNSKLGQKVHCREWSKKTKKIISSWTWINEKPDGICEDWYENGKIRQRYTYRIGHLVDTSYKINKDGTVSRAIVCSKLDDVCTDSTWHPNRRLARESRLANGKEIGTTRSFNENGSLMSTETYAPSGKKDGLHAHWSSKQILSDSTIYKEGLIQFRWVRDTTKNRLRSRWQFGPDGQTLISAECFDPNGKSSGRVVDGTGALLFYNARGNTIGRETYQSGILIKDESFGE